MADSIRGTVIANGLALPNVLVRVYLAGTSTLASLFSDVGLSVPITNDGVTSPLTEADGSYGPFYLADGLYDIKYLKTGHTFDDSDTAGLRLINVALQWSPSGLVPTYISATSFSVPGNQTAELHVGRRIQAQCTGGTRYGTITASVYTSLTTVTVTLDSGSLDSGLSTVNLSFLTYTNPAIHKVPLLDHGTKSGSFTLEMSAADVHIIAFSAVATLTIGSSLTSDKSTVIIKNGANAITLAGIDNNSPTLTNGASKQDFITLVKSFGKITCISQILDETTS